MKGAGALAICRPEAKRKAHTEVAPTGSGKRRTPSSQRRGTQEQIPFAAQVKQEVCATKAELDDIVFHGGGKAGEVLAVGGAFDLDAELVFVFGARFAQDSDGAECFVINAGDEIGFAGAVLLPKLTDLNLPRAHSDALNVDRPARSVNSPCGREYTVRRHYLGGREEETISRRGTS